MSRCLRHDVEDVSQFREECVELVPPFLLGEVPGVPFALVHHTLAVVEVHHGCYIRKKTMTSIRTGGDARWDRVILLRTGPGFRFVWRLPITCFGPCFFVNPGTKKLQFFLIVTLSAIDKLFEIFGPIFEQNATINFEPIFE